MRTMILFACVVYGVLAITAGDTLEEKRAIDMSRARGYAYGAQGKECFYVVDQDGVPVAGARIYGCFVGGPDVNGFTDKNGVYIAKGRCKDWLSYSFSKEGYYETQGAVRYLDTTSFPAVVSGKWQPYGSSHKVILKKIKSPKKMISQDLSDRKFFGRYKCPTLGKWFGFDFARKDWVRPFGEGECSDVLLRFTHDDSKNFYSAMEVSFTNSPYAGAYIMDQDTFSEFKTAYIVDTNKTFKAYYQFDYENTSAGRHDNILRKDQYMVFRIRTKIDEKGRLISAQYGRLIGRWGYLEGKMQMPNVFLNPVPNDLNLEDAETARKAVLSYKQFLEQLQNEK